MTSVEKPVNPIKGRLCVINFIDMPASWSGGHRLIQAPATCMSVPVKSMRCLLFLALLALAASGCQTAGRVAAKPLYRDPVFDGAADPVVIWNPQVKKWWMFYTNRRANVPGLSGVTWVHGTPIGIAESADAGATWKYVGDAQFDLPENYGGTDLTTWAPDVIRSPDGTWQMFLTIVPGIFEDWNHPRFIVQLTSTDLVHWKDPRKLALASDRVIDPSIERMPDGTWRLYYNDERAGKAIDYATSPDLTHWTDKGRAFKSRGEGPKGFRWHNKYWVIIDEWKDQACIAPTMVSIGTSSRKTLSPAKGGGRMMVRTAIIAMWFSVATTRISFTSPIPAPAPAAIRTSNAAVPSR